MNIVVEAIRRIARLLWCKQKRNFFFSSSSSIHLFARWFACSYEGQQVKKIYIYINVPHHWIGFNIDFLFIAECVAFTGGTEKVKKKKQKLFYRVKNRENRIKFKINLKARFTNEKQQSENWRKKKKKNQIIEMEPRCTRSLSLSLFLIFCLNLKRP